MSGKQSKNYERLIPILVQSGCLEVRPDGSIWRLKRVSRQGATAHGRFPYRADDSIDKGYRHVCLTVDGKSVKCLAHRIVWQYFHGDIPEAIEINHRNGIRHDNHPSNLELASATDNMLHATYVLGSMTHDKGMKHANHKLTNDEVRSILHLHSKGSTCAAMALRFNVSEGLIRHIVKGRAWQHITRLSYVNSNKPKFTPEQVKAIRERRAAGETLTSIGEAFGTSISMVSIIARRKIYRHIA